MMINSDKVLFKLYLLNIRMNFAEVEGNKESKGLKESKDLKESKGLKV